jgi:uncharacterized metal-binding protein YceD (DUF177 family)
MTKKEGDVTFLLIIFFIGRGFIILQTEKKVMPGLYSIPLAGLKEGRYTYEFAIGNDFFEAFEASEIKRGELMAKVILEKCTTHLQLDIEIKGNVEVMCDRCLENFYMPLSCTNRLFVKQGKEWAEADPDMITMPLDEHEIDLSQFFYEYIHLALPIKRIHPEDKKGRSVCDPEMIRRLEDNLVAGEDISDPRWDELKKLTMNN